MEREHLKEVHSLGEAYFYHAHREIVAVTVGGRVVPDQWC
jgi:hypothetical protein